MPSHHALPPGTLIAGKYEVRALLGEGGMGAVYLATNVAVGKRVAVKVLHAAVADEENIRHRFELEARAAALINHPGIVDVLDMGETPEGEPYIVMEHLEGAPLSAIAKELKVVAPEEAVGVMVPVLEALAAAHKAGVVHRDVKPANVFVCLKPRAVKLLDFGVSRFGEGSGMTGTGQAIGTPRYMSPEQVRGDRGVGPPADLFSVGAVLYSLLCGRPPHGSGSSTSVLAHILSEPAEPLASVAPMVPKALCAVVDGLLLKDPAARPSDALAVRDALLAAVPQTDTAALFEVAERSTRAAAVAPTPTSSRAVRKPTAPSQPAAVDREAATIASGGGGRKGLLLPAVVGGAALLLLGGGVALYASRPGPAPAPQPAAMPTPVPVPAKPALVTVTLTAEPASARILVDEVDLGCNPCKLAGEAGAVRSVRVRAAGYAESALRLELGENRTERVVLAPLPPEPTAGPDAGAEPVQPGPDAGAAAPPVQPAAVKRKVRGGGLNVDETNPYQ